MSKRCPMVRPVVSSPRRIIGIDPGSHLTGWGIIESQGSSLRRLASGTVVTSGGELAERLAQIADALDKILVDHSPNAASIEGVFHHKNSQSALKLGQARGAALVCVARASCPLFEYSPAEVKKGITGNGRASKEQVQRMVSLLLGYHEKMGWDESDALAVAICHANRNVAIGR